MIKILHVYKYYISIQNTEIILPYKIFKISHIVFQLNKQNKLYLNASIILLGKQNCWSSNINVCVCFSFLP